MNTLLAQLTPTQINIAIIFVTLITAVFIWLIVGTVEYNAGMHRKPRTPANINTPTTTTTNDSSPQT